MTLVNLIKEAKLIGTNWLTGTDTLLQNLYILLETVHLLSDQPEPQGVYFKELFCLDPGCPLGSLGVSQRICFPGKGQKPLPLQLFPLCAALTKGPELESFQYGGSGGVRTRAITDKSTWEIGVGAGRIG